MKGKIMSLMIAVITGMGIGMPITLLCMILIGGYNPVMKEFIVWLVASALYGIISVFILGNERFNLIVATGLHCVCCLAITVGAGVLCGYSNTVSELLLNIFPVFFVVYAVIYLVSIMRMKSKAKEVNESLKENQ